MARFLRRFFCKAFALPTSTGQQDSAALFLDGIFAGVS
jgi:hypothetical protein